MEFYYNHEAGNFVCPVADAPGYFYEWVEPIGDWVMKYKPIPGFYSPPIFDTNLSWYQISVPEGISFGALIGDGALHFEKPFVSLPFEDSAEGWYEHWSGAAYIFYRQDINKIEVWSSDLSKTLIRVVGWLESVQSFAKSLPPKRTLKKLV